MLLPVEGVVALLLAEDALAVGGVLVRVLVVLTVELREADGEGEQDQQEQAQELPELLQHLAHGDLRRDQKDTLLMKIRWMLTLLASGAHTF